METPVKNCVNEGFPNIIWRLWTAKHHRCIFTTSYFLPFHCYLHSIPDNSPLCVFCYKTAALYETSCKIKILLLNMCGAHHVFHIITTERM